MHLKSAFICYDPIEYELIDKRTLLLLMTMIIHHDISIPDAHKRSSTMVSRTNMWAWIILSILLHSGLLIVLSTFSNPPDTPRLTAPPILNARLIIPLAPKPSPSPEPPREAFKEPLKIESSQLLPETIKNDTSISNVAGEDSVVDVLTPIDTPEVALMKDESAQTDMIKAQAKIAFQRAQRQAMAQYFNQRSGIELDALSRAQANAYAKEQISPRLFKGTVPLSAQMQDAKLIHDAKIDVDCAQGINQVLATISAFTLQAVVCQQKGDIDPFIQKRLQKLSPRERSSELLTPKRREPKP